MRFSHTQRHTPVPADIDRESFDVIVIGAGINGTGIARDAAMRGLKVLLLDKGDIGSGTSSYSGRMIHGGLRYLEHGDIGLVRESLRERANLLRIAPHLVKPQPLFIPFYQSNKHKPWQVKAGLTVLDLFAICSRSSLGVHKTLSRQSALERMPGLNPDGLTGAGVMTDAYADYAERLCIENALSASREGAGIITYAAVEDLMVEQGRVKGVHFRDVIGQRTYKVRATVTVNVAGPWVDRVLQTGPKTERLIGGTKGSFLVVDSFVDGPIDSCFFEAVADQRQVVVLPWNGCYLLGTTDIRYDDDPDDAAAGQREVHYLLEETNRAFPRAKLTRDSIRFTYAGVRPLPYMPQGAEGSITRKHIVYDHGPRVEGLISIVGGKFSTFRSLARETVDCVLGKLSSSASRRPGSGCRTDAMVLPGGSEDFPSFCAQFGKEAGIPEKSRERLLRVYGTRSAEILTLVKDTGDELKQPLDPNTGAIGAEILFAFRHEFAETLVDVLLRRTMVGYESAFDPIGVENAVRVARKYLAWSDERVEEEQASYRDYIRRFHPRAGEGKAWLG